MKIGLIRKRVAIGGLCHVQLLDDTLIEKFQPHSRNDGQTPEFEPVLGKNRAVPSLTRVQIA